MTSYLLNEFLFSIEAPSLKSFEKARRGDKTKVSTFYSK